MDAPPLRGVAGPLNRLEERLADPGDTETRRIQKVVVVVVAAVGAIATGFNAVPLFSGGLDDMGWTYVASGIYLALGALTLYLWPRAYAGITFVLLLDVIAFPGIVQVLSGGVTSGLMAVPWLLFAPLGAALALGAVAASVHLGIFTVAMAVVTLLDPWARTIGPTIPADIAVTFNLGSLLSLGLMAGASSLYLVRQVDRFRGRADRILFEILPSSIATRLKAGDQEIVDEFDSVTVGFVDIVDFTHLSADAGPGETVGFLDHLFRQFDDLAAAAGVEKIKTIGDAYMVAGGLPGGRPDHVRATVEFALAVLVLVADRPCFGVGETRVRIGIHTGPVVAGLVGRDRFLYDLWGDTVNVASRMETTGLPDAIQATQAVVDAVGAEYPFRGRGPVEVKGKGLIETYLLEPGSPS